MENLYGSIDLTKLGNVVRQHPELIKSVQFKDGLHKMLKINVNGKMEDNFGNVAYLRVGIKREDMKQGVSYFLGDLKVSNFNGGASRVQRSNTTQESRQTDEGNDDLPF